MELKINVSFFILYEKLHSIINICFVWNIIALRKIAVMTSTHCFMRIHTFLHASYTLTFIDMIDYLTVLLFPSGFQVDLGL